MTEHDWRVKYGKLRAAAHSLGTDWTAFEKAALPLVPEGFRAGLGRIFANEREKTETYLNLVISIAERRAEGSSARRNDEERADWIDNDEGLYSLWKRSRLPKREFIRRNRDLIDQAIDRVLTGEEPAHSLLYGVGHRGGSAAARPKARIAFYEVGLVERPSGRRDRRPTYVWKPGYSRRPDGGAQPWRTRREAEAQARAQGARARFIHRR
jgi:hypothetical protein